MYLFLGELHNKTKYYEASSVGAEESCILNLVMSINTWLLKQNLQMFDQLLVFHRVDSRHEHLF